MNSYEVGQFCILPLINKTKIHFTGSGFQISISKRLSREKGYMFLELASEIKSSVEEWSVLKGQVYKIKLSLSSFNLCNRHCCG